MHQNYAPHRSGQLASLPAYPALPDLNHIARLASRLLETSIATVTLVTQQEQYVIGAHGLPASDADGQVPLDHDFNTHVIVSGAVLAIDDVAAAMLAHASRSGAAYLGLPLRDANEQVIGAIAVVNATPRHWSADDIDALDDLRLVAEHELSHQTIDTTLQLFAASVEQTSEAILITSTDLNDGPRIIYVNQAFVAMSGYNAAELIGQKPQLLQGPQTDRELLKHLRIALGNGEPFVGETINYRKDGTTYAVEWHIAPLRDQHGELRYWVSTQRDMTARNQAAAKLQASESRFRDLAANSPDFIYIVDVAARHTVFFNRSSFLGYTTAEMERSGSIMAAVHPDDMALAQAFWQQVLSAPATISQVEYRLRSTDGDWEWIESRAVILANDANQSPLQILMTLRVITDRKLADAALRESEDHYRTIAETAMDAILVVDDTSTITFANRAATQTFGYSAEELKGQPVTLLMPHGMQQRHTHAFEHYKATGQRKLSSWAALDFPGQHRDGRIIPLEISLGEMMRAGRRVFIAVLRDVSRRKQMELDLQKSDNLLHSVIEGTTDAIFIKDQAGRYLAANAATAALFGIPASTLIGHDDTMLFTPAEVATIALVEQQIMTTGTSHMFEEAFMINGRKRTFLTTKTPFRDAAGAMIGLIVIARDITERKLLEAQFLQAQKMESVGRLAGGVAHDFNNMLTAILGYTDFLLDQTEADPLMHSDLLEIKRAAQRATKITQQLLAFARQQTIESRPTDLNALLAEMSNLIQRLIGEDIEFTLVPCAESVVIHADPGQIEQVVVNLAVNARDAMPRGGQLTIALAATELPAEAIQQHEVAPGQYIDLRISDSGSGMDEATKQRLFEPFFTTKERGRGTGLGLATCYGIIKQHGGHIWVESAIGMGTTIHVLLPLVEQVPVIERNSAKPETLPLGTETVLLVEDEATVRALARRILERQGYNVIEATNGVDALNLLAEPDCPTFDLLITDIIMPYIGGVVLANELRERGNNLPTLFLSGYADSSMSPQLPTERSSFLQKPFTPHALAQAVRQLLDAPHTAATNGYHLLPGNQAAGGSSGNTT